MSQYVKPYVDNNILFNTVKQFSDNSIDNNTFVNMSSFTMHVLKVMKMVGYHQDFTISKILMNSDFQHSS